MSSQSKKIATHLSAANAMSSASSSNTVSAPTADLTKTPRRKMVITEEVLEDDEEEEDEVPRTLTVAYVKFDFVSTDDDVELWVRVYTKDSNDDEVEIEQEEDEYLFYREDGEVTDESMTDVLGILLETGVGMPEEYVDYIKNILNAMIKDPTEYEDDDIRILWDRFPDNLPPAVEPRPLQGEVKVAVDEFLSQPNVVYR